MIDPLQIKKHIRTYLPRRILSWLWSRKVARGNSRIQELKSHLTGQVHAAAQRENELGERLRTVPEWEQFRDQRLEALRRSLGVLPQRPAALNLQVTNTLEGDQFRVENIVFHSHSEVMVTGNLYRPRFTSDRAPGLLLCHSHHDPKTEEELQILGITLSQLGCVVLVIDLVGHGERRQHPFSSDANFSGPFLLDRQDYYFRLQSRSSVTINWGKFGWVDGVGPQAWP